MKSRRWFVILTLLLAGLLIGVTQAVVATATSNVPTALVLINATAPAELERLQQEELTIYAHLNGGMFLAGADTAARNHLAAANLSFQVLDDDVSNAAYYLVYLLPGQREVAWAEYGRFLYANSDLTILRATPAQAARLSAAGFRPHAVTFDPKPLQPAPARIPTAIEPDPLIQTMMDQVISSTVYQYTGGLSGEWPVTIGGSSYTIATRHTQSGTPIQKATQFVGEHLAALGLDVEYHQWSGATYPNVIGEITGQVNPNDIYILSAHLDDMPIGLIAPGADDNASGVVAALIAADIFSQYNWGCTIRFGLWTGEEQGLLGSSAYAQRAYNSGENILGVLNLDMIAWNTPGSSRDIDLHANASMPATLALAQLFAEVVADYNVNLIPGIVPNGSGASDHASFWQYGYTAILGIEDFADFNPRYHTVNDRLQYLDMDYYTDFVKASIATFAHMSDCLIPAGIGYLDGMVTAAGSGDPIPGAEIAIQNTSGNTFMATTDASGYYTRTLLSGTYRVTAAAYGYLPATMTDVVVVTDTVTTQNLQLDPAATYTVSGMVTEAGSGLPLFAQITFAGSPVTVNTNPATGSYQALLPQGTYTMHVSAIGHRPAAREITVDQNQVQNFILEPLPCILLVDDDNNAPDVRPYYTAALDTLGYDYDVFDVGGGSQNGPTLAELQGYNIVVWFSGDKYGGESAGPNSSDEVNLATYLNGGGSLFLSSQDYLYDMGLTSFGQTYLGVGSFSNDSGDATTKYGVAGDPIGSGLGPYPLTYPAGFTDYGDIVNPAVGASLAFRSSAAGGNSLDIDKSSANWKTVFFGTSWVPIYNNNAANGREVLARIIDWFGCPVCEPAQVISVTTAVNACTVDFTPTYSGTPPFVWDWVFQGGTPATSQLEAPMGIDFGISGTYAYTVTANNCAGIPAVFTELVTVSCESCTPVAGVSLTQVTTGTIYAGDVVTFSLETLPETAVPYTYTVMVGETTVITAQTGSTTPLFFNHAFTQSGSYSVTVSVWNCDMTLPVTATLVVVVSADSCTPITNVSLTQVTTGTIYAGDVVTFSLETLPETAVPYTYTVMVGETTVITAQTGSTTPLFFSHTFMQGSSYTVTVAVWNCDMTPLLAVLNVVVLPEPQPGYRIFLPVALRDGL